MFGCTCSRGANDLSLGTTVPSCLQALPAPFGVSCKSWQTAVGDRTDAQVVLLGYLTYWKPNGCYGTDPIWAVDANWLQSIFDRLNATLAQTAAANGASYVDIRTPSATHGLCASPAERWVEGLLPLSPAAPYHPNARGMAAAGAIVADAID